MNVKIYGPRLFEKENQDIEEYILRIPHKDRIACIEICTTGHLQKIPHQNIISDIKIQLV